MSTDNINFLDEPNKALEFCNVSFTYHNGTEVLRNLNFTFHSGQHYALVGENGAGKSTTTKLILGLYTPSDGEILVNGININSFNREKLLNHFGIVF